MFVLVYVTGIDPAFLASSPPIAIAACPSTFTFPPMAIDWSPVTTAPSSARLPLPIAMPCVTSAATREFDPIAIARLVFVKPAPVLVSACAFLPITILSSLKDFAPLPIATPFSFIAELDGPIAIELGPVAPSLFTLLLAPFTAELIDT